MQFFLKIFSGMANNVDPQTVPSGAVCSGSALFAYEISCVYLSKGGVFNDYSEIFFLNIFP